MAGLKQQETQATAAAGDADATGGRFVISWQISTRDQIRSKEIDRDGCGCCRSIERWS